MSLCPCCVALAIIPYYLGMVVKTPFWPSGFIYDIYHSLDGFGLITSSGHLRKKSATWSIGAASSPTAVSQGGLFGALGCDRLGTNIFVRPNDLARRSLSAGVIACSSLTKSLVSSSSMCVARSFIRDLIVGMKSGSDGSMSWNFLSFSLTLCSSQRYIKDRLGDYGCTV
jgi:hypothetical protein